jgi:exopolysaccharide biosynthesis polyprenyl glycosylphosphotransferase
VKPRRSLIPFVLAELMLLLAVVLPIAHARSFGERLLLAGKMPAIAPDEGRYILLRSLVMVLVLQIAFALRDLYRWTVITRPQLTVMRLVEGVSIGMLLLLVLHYVLGSVDTNLELNGALRRLQIHPLLVVAASSAAFLAGYGLRMRWPRWMRQARLGERVLLVGTGPGIDVATEELRRRHDPGIVLVGCLAEGGAGGRRPETLGTPRDLAAVVAERGVQRVVLAPGTPVTTEALNGVRLAGVRVMEVPAFYEQLTGRISVEDLSAPGLLLDGTAGSGPGAAALRRTLDVLIAAVGLALALPICALAAVLIKVESRGPVLYRQERVGRNGRVFTLAKFRSMRVDAEDQSGPVWATEADPRITRVGRWLRGLRLDELPQLWSVIRNDMSLVGPRPERPYFVEELERRIPHFAERHTVKPGVTGWAQINHSYGNSLDDAFIKLQHDLYYVKHRTLALDAAILLRTVKVVVLQQGAV